MGRYDKLMQKVLSGRQDASLSFADPASLLQALGFTERVRGSHHIFFRADVEEILNIQPRGSQAKPYQVKQVRDVIVRYQLEVPE